MKELLNLLSIIVLCVFATHSFGQQDPQFTQYSDNMLFVNPAYAGSRGVLNLTAMHREQWIGLKAVLFLPLSVHTHHSIINL